MYCPNCGKSAGDAVECTACGLPLGAVGELLATNAVAVARHSDARRRRTDDLIAKGLFLGLVAALIGIALGNLRKQANDDKRGK